MKSIREKNGGFGSNRLSQEQIRAEFLTRICDLEPHVNRDEKETIRAKEEIGEEIKREDLRIRYYGNPDQGKRNSATL